jgi:hypothetical protein
MTKARRFPRFSVKAPCAVEFWNRDLAFRTQKKIKLEGQVINVAPGGIALAVRWPRRDSAPLSNSPVNITFKAGSRFVTLPAKVVWAIKADGVVEAGFRFHLELADDTTRELFGRWLMGLSKQPSQGLAARQASRRETA